jgi:hypothetical protein
MASPFYRRDITLVELVLDASSGFGESRLAASQLMGEMLEGLAMQ